MHFGNSHVPFVFRFTLLYTLNIYSLANSSVVSHSYICDLVLTYEVRTCGEASPFHPWPAEHNSVFIQEIGIMMRNQRISPLGKYKITNIPTISENTDTKPLSRYRNVCRVKSWCEANSSLHF